MLAAARGGRSGGRRAVHPRDDNRDERAARAEGRADRLRYDRRLRAPPPPAPADARAPLPALRAAARAARAARALLRSGRADRTRRGRSAARSARPCPSSTPRRSPSACSSSFRDPAPRAGRRRRAPAAPSRTRTSSPRTRSRPEFREYERALDDRRRRLPRAPDRPLPRARSGWPAAGRGLPEPLVMRSSGGVATLAEAAGARGARCSSRARPAAPSAPRGSPRSPASRTRSRSTWAAPRPTSAWSPAARPRAGSERSVGGLPVRAADDRHPHGRRRRRLARLDRRRRGAARRAAQRRRRCPGRPATAAAAPTRP